MSAWGQTSRESKGDLRVANCPRSILIHVGSYIQKIHAQLSYLNTLTQIHNTHVIRDANLPRNRNNPRFSCQNIDSLDLPKSIEIILSYRDVPLPHPLGGFCLGPFGSYTYTSLPQNVVALVFMASLTIHAHRYIHMSGPDALWEHR